MKKTDINVQNVKGLIQGCIEFSTKKLQFYFHNLLQGGQFVMLHIERGIIGNFLLNT